MAHVKIQYDVMDAFCMDVFQRFGFTKEESRIISDVLLLSDVYGIESHGAQQIGHLRRGVVFGTAPYRRCQTSRLHGASRLVV